MTQHCKLPLALLQQLVRDFPQLASEEKPTGILALLLGCLAYPNNKELATTLHTAMVAIVAGKIPSKLYFNLRPFVTAPVTTATVEDFNFKVHTYFRLYPEEIYNRDSLMVLAVCYCLAFRKVSWWTKLLIRTITRTLRFKMPDLWLYLSSLIEMIILFNSDRTFSGPQTQYLFLVSQLQYNLLPRLVQQLCATPVTHPALLSIINFYTDRD